VSKCWVAINRRLLDSHLWRGERFTRGQAWVDLILNANHKEKRVWLKGTPVTIQRGEQIRSKVTLVKAWKWNERTVTRFLNMLELEGMIKQKSTNQTTYITICNYSKYQDKEENSTDQSTDQSTRRVQTRVQTNNNVNNDNKRNSKDIGAKKQNKLFKPPDINQVNAYLNERCSSHINGQNFIDHHQARGWVMSNRQKMKDWKAAVRTWISNDKKFNAGNNYGQQKQTRNLSAVERVEQATAKRKAERDNQLR